MNIMYFIVFVLVNLFILRKFIQKLSELSFASNIYALRDKFRWMVINKEIEISDEIFYHYEDTFATLLKNRSQLSVYHILHVTIITLGDKTLAKQLVILEQEQMKSKKLAEIQSELSSELVNFVKKQHLITFSLLLMVAKVFGTGKQVKDILVNISNSLLAKDDRLSGLNSYQLVS